MGAGAICSYPSPALVGRGAHYAVLPLALSPFAADLRSQLQKQEASWLALSPHSPPHSGGEGQIEGGANSCPPWLWPWVCGTQVRTPFLCSFLKATYHHHKLSCREKSTPLTLFSLQEATGSFDVGETSIASSFPVQSWGAWMHV